jgi:nuclear transport factor 2 (NTF2) superfamily protein
MPETPMLDRRHHDTARSFFPTSQEREWIWTHVRRFRRRSLRIEPLPADERQRQFARTLWAHTDGEPSLGRLPSIPVDAGLPPTAMAFGVVFLGALG